MKAAKEENVLVAIKHFPGDGCDEVDQHILTSVNSLSCEEYQMNDMVKGCLYLFAALPMENGQVGACVFLEPEPEVDDTVMFDYSLLFITALWDYYKHTNDREALEDLWDTVKTQISLGIKQVGERTLMSLLMEEQSSTVIAMHGAVHRHIFFADIIVKSKR